MGIVDVRGVNKTYTDLTSGKEVHALDNISVSVEEKDFLILLGPSGCGKSTLLNIIAGLIPHDGGGGEVSVEGNLVTGPNPKLMAYMFQDPVLYPWRTVVKNVEFGL
jgi:NitT/TauT family transport system ATP-binding protein